MLPIITMIGPSLAGIFAGSFILERMFAIPGLGFYYVKAVSDNDYTMVIGLTIFFAIFKSYSFSCRNALIIFILCPFSNT